MKRIEAVIRPEKLDELRETLDSKGYSGMTVSEVKGRGTQKGVTLEWRVGEYKVEFLPKIRLEMVVLDKDVDEVIKSICSVCSTGSIGDGKIFVSDVSYVVRIRTGEAGVVAI